MGRVFFYSEPEAPSVPSRLPSSQERNVVHQKHDLRFQPQTGFNYTYSFSRQIEIHGLSSPIPPVAYHGELVIHILHADHDGFEAVVQDHVVENEESTRVSLRILATAKADRLLVFQSDSIEPQNAQSISILKDLVAHWLFPYESDTVGSYRSTLEQQGDEGGLLKFKKTKIAYENQSHPVPEILASSHLLKWDHTLHMPQSLQVDELTQMVGESQITLHSRASYQMKLMSAKQGVSRNSYEVASLKNQTSLSIMDSPQSLDLNPEYQAIQWPVVAQQLLHIEKQSSADQLKALGDLIKALKLGRVSTQDLLDFLQTQDVIKQGAQSQLYKTVMGALASVGTPEAQAALMKVYQDPSNIVSGKGAILTALTTMPSSQTKSTQDFLLQAIKNESNPSLSEGAAFAVSSSPSPPVIDTIHQMWLEQNITAIDMMGNSGDATFVPDLQKIIQTSDDVSLRAKAVFALRAMSGSAAATLITQSLSDPEPRVREAALQAIQTQQSAAPYQVALQACSAQDTNDYIRSQCRKLVSQ